MKKSLLVLFTIVFLTGCPNEKKSTVQAVAAETCMVCPTGPQGPRGETGEAAPIDDSNVQQGGDRLVALVETKALVGEDGSIYRTRVQTDRFFDSVLNLNCRLLVDAEGQMRCLPVTPLLVDGYYEDSACTLPLAQNADCTTEPYALGAIEVENSCPVQTRYDVYQVGSEVSPNRIYAQGKDGCEVSSPGTGLRFYRAIKISPEQFVAFAEE
jgi:hypothetical protein